MGIWGHLQTIFFGGGGGGGGGGRARPALLSVNASVLLLLYLVMSNLLKLGIIVGCKKAFFALISEEGRSSALQSFTKHDVMGGHWRIMLNLCHIMLCQHYW